MNSNPNKAQKDWHQFLLDHGSSVLGGMGSGLSLHHIGGSKMKIKGIKKPGEWYCICLSYWWHQDGRNPAARHVNKKRFEYEADMTEKDMFIEKVRLFEYIYGRKPMPEPIFEQLVLKA